jgi:hypothetical protein
MVSFLFIFFLSVQFKIYNIFSFWHVSFLHPWDLENVYEDMLNNIVSLIDHVVISHQNNTRTNDI